MQEPCSNFDQIHDLSPNTDGCVPQGRVQTASFLIEFDDTQDAANHIHSVGRDFAGDFGADLLKLHYETGHQKKW